MILIFQNLILQLRDFAETQHLPVIAENCPACFESPKERHRTKQVWP